MKYLLFVVCFSVFHLYAQEDEYEEYPEEEEVSDTIEKPGKEIGFDLNLSASTFGGTGGLGVKFAFPIKGNFVAGPSFRYQYSWYKFNGYASSYSIYGAGAFLHYRMFKYFFVGTEIEILNTPIQNGYLSSQRSWVPVALLGGGFSYAFSPNFRFSAGIMYDVINHVNSPLRPGYFVRNSQNVLQPVIYRIAFFIAL